MTDTPPVLISRPRRGPAPRVECRHCGRVRAVFAKGLCGGCYKEPGVRGQYPAPPRPAAARKPAPAVGGGLVVVWRIDPVTGVRVVGYDPGSLGGSSVRFELDFPAGHPDRVYVEGLIHGAVRRATRAKRRRRADGHIDTD